MSNEEAANVHPDEGWTVCRDCDDHLGPGCVAVTIKGEAVCHECAPLLTGDGRRQW